MKTVYDFTVKDRKGNDVSLSEYKGKVLLIVNTAPGCGFTPHYDPLEAMYKELRDKGFEILEASHLFSLPEEKIAVVVHRESIIHSMVEYVDNSVIAQLSVPDMRLCVQYALTGPTRTPSPLQQLDLISMGKLSFYPPDMETFVLLPCAIRAIRAGGALPAVLNASNEVAVAHFLNHEITFRQIFDTVTRVVDELSAASRTHDLDGILAWDLEARALTEQYLTKA